MQLVKRVELRAPRFYRRAILRDRGVVRLEEVAAMRQRNS